MRRKEERVLDRDPEDFGKWSEVRLRRMALDRTGGYGCGSSKSRPRCLFDMSQVKDGEGSTKSTNVNLLQGDTSYCSLGSVDII